MKKVAVFAGSFDPFTKGHFDVVARASHLFDELWVVVARNAEKKYLFDVEERVDMVKAAVEKMSNVHVAEFDGLTVKFMEKVGAKFLVRGIRGASDVDAEQSLCWNNKALNESVETVLLFSAPENLAVSSTAVRELMKCAQDKAELRKYLSKFVPSVVVKKIVSRR